MKCDFITSVSVDSRNIKKNSWFFALKGERVDGHQFVHEAFMKGAKGVVVKYKQSKLPNNFPQIVVESPLKFLQECAKQLIVNKGLNILAVTGSIGKSTAKNFLYQLLKGILPISVSLGNQNSQVGCPMSLINESQECGSYHVAEMGMSHPGELRRLVTMAPPKISLITHVTWAHGEHFDDLEALQKEKCTIASQWTEHCLVPFVTKPYLPKDYKGSSHTFSMNHKEADYFLDREKDFCTLYKAQKPYFQFTTPNKLQKAWDENLLGVLGVIDQLGISLSLIKDKIPTLTGVEGRYQLVEREGVIFINDAYNACVRSFEAAFDHFPVPEKGGRRVAVIGGMVEQGIFSFKNHDQVLKKAIKTCDLIFCLGQEYKSRYASNVCFHYSDFYSLVEELKKRLRQNDVVLLKASHSFGLWRTIDAIFPM